MLSICYSALSIRLWNIYNKRVHFTEWTKFLFSLERTQGDQLLAYKIQGFFLKNLWLHSDFVHFLLLWKALTDFHHLLWRGCYCYDYLFCLQWLEHHVHSSQKTECSKLESVMNSYSHLSLFSCWIINLIKISPKSCLSLLAFLTIKFCVLTICLYLYKLINRR